jgi:hypothetical protein
MSFAIVLVILILFSIIGGSMWWFTRKPEGTSCKPDSADANSNRYQYDSNGKCILYSCKDGYAPSGNSCSKIGNSCKPDSADANSDIYQYDSKGNCILYSCKPGWLVASDSCIKTSSGATCTPTNPVPHSTQYILDKDGTCQLNECEYKWYVDGDTCTQKNDYSFIANTMVNPFYGGFISGIDPPTTVDACKTACSADTNCAIINYSDDTGCFLNKQTEQFINVPNIQLYKKN